MAIEFRCTQCNKLLRTGDDTAGKRAKCPECGTVLTIPAASPPPDQPAPSSVPPPMPPADSPFAGADAGAASQSPAGASAAPGAGPGAEAGELTPHPIDFGDVIGRTFEIYKQQWTTCLVAFLVVIGVSIGAFICFGILVGVSAVLRIPALTALLAFVGYLAIFAVGVWLYVGQVIFFLKVARGQPAAVGDLFTGTPYFLPVLGASLLFCLVYSVGLMLCVVPGIILALMFSQFAFLIVDRNAGALDSFTLSKHITNGSKLMLFLVYLVVGIVGELLIAVTLGIGVLAVVPFFVLLTAVTYLAMTGQPTADQLQQQQQ
jgi:phage FluMu protein Com